MYTERKTHEREKVMIWLTWNKSNPYLLPEILNILPSKEKGFKSFVIIFLPVECEHVHVTVFL